MLRLEAQLPGFGGFFIDSLGEVVVYMRSSDEFTPANVRALLHLKYAARPEAPVRSVMAPAARARILEGAYALSELIATENRIVSRAMGIKGIVGVGTSLIRNRVKVGFRDSLSMTRGLDAIASAGVPLAALIPEVWGELRLEATWKSKIRPTRGGIGIHVRNQTAMPNWGAAGSHGFNVRTSNGTNYFMTASHVAQNYRGINGLTGDTVFQYDRAWPGTPIGVIELNPAWNTGASCPFDSTTQTGADMCTEADVALGRFIGGVTGERKIGTSVYEGQNGQPGTQDINGYYPIQGVLSPEFVMTSTHGVHKSGQTTGTTTGEIDVPLTTIFVTAGFPSAPPPPSNHLYLALQNVARVAHAGHGGGDSGGAVFAGNGSPYYALGIHVGGDGTISNGICNAGVNCAFYFARWDRIEARFGLGPLNPNTVQ
ncbi:MAG TPA: hypothetical protein VES88_12825 [Gemmatimonadaceae bacterium]|nr:hypothetical protein [Gemmatimonadaceae bacterium]